MPFVIQDDLAAIDEAVEYFDDALLRKPGVNRRPWGRLSSTLYNGFIARWLTAG
jgi:hypothetical protein